MVELKSILKFILVCCVGLLGAGCSQSEPTDRADEYVQSVARALDRNILVMPADPRPSFPSQRELRIPLTALKIDVVEFAQLHSCDMGGLVGRRNSPTGRLQGNSQRLMYELEWLERVRSCELGSTAWLQELTMTKENQIPALWWNAIMAGPEMQHVFGAATQQLTSDSEPLFNLGYLRQASLGEVRAKLEPNLYQLKTRVHARNMLQRWQKLVISLSAVSENLNKRVPPVCLTAQPNNRSRRLLAAFRHYYLPWQAEFSGQIAADGEWVNAYAQIVNTTAVDQPQSFKTWYGQTLQLDSPTSLWNQVNNAIVEHSRAWQELLASCGQTVQDIATEPT